MDKKIIIERICYFRNKAKLSQKELSLRIGMNIGYINRLESKQDFLPSVEVLLRIIDECQSTVEEFFYNDIFCYQNDKQLLQLITALSPEKKQALITLLTK